MIESIGLNRGQDPHSWPFGIDQLMSLPGIARSTVGSIISFAFDFPTPILDGNVKRIFSRLVSIERTSTKGDKRLWE